MGTRVEALPPEGEGRAIRGVNIEPCKKKNFPPTASSENTREEGVSLYPWGQGLTTALCYYLGSVTNPSSQDPAAADISHSVSCAYAASWRGNVAYGGGQHCVPCCLQELLAFDQKTGTGLPVGLEHKQILGLICTADRTGKSRP